MEKPRLPNPALFICDIQEKFRSAIYEFPSILNTAQKMIEACKILSIPIYCTTQNASRLGSTVSEISDVLPADARQVDKTAFSMMVPEISALLLQQAQAFSYAQDLGSPSLPPSQNNRNNSKSGSNSGNINSNHSATVQPLSPCQILLMGIESHICVLQTATDLLALGHRVYVLADGVSSCHAGERVIALERLRHEGCVVTTSESVIFEMIGDAGRKEFRDVVALVKRWKQETGSAVERLCGSGMALGSFEGIVRGGGDGDGGATEQIGKGEGAEGGKESGGASSRL